MTNQRYRKIQYIMRRLSYHMQICDELCDEEATQQQNFGQHMEDECDTCRENIICLEVAFRKIEEAIQKLKQIDP